MNLVNPSSEDRLNVQKENVNRELLVLLKFLFLSEHSLNRVVRPLMNSHSLLKELHDSATVCFLELESTFMKTF